MDKVRCLAVRMADSRTIRRSVRRGREGERMLDCAAWHEMVLTVGGAQFRTEVDGKVGL